MTDEQIVNNDYVILARDRKSDTIAFATPTAFKELDEANAYGHKHLKGQDWLVVHSAFVKEIIEYNMWTNEDEGDV